MNDLQALVTLPAVQTGADLIDAWLRGRKPTTRGAYRGDLADFAKFCEAPDSRAAAMLLLAHGPGAANRLGLAYRAHLAERSLAPATVNRRLAALKSLVGLARLLGLVTWRLEVPGERSRAYRDTRGPGMEAACWLMRQASKAPGAKGPRDLAICRLLYAMALRRGEVVSLNVADVDLQAGKLKVTGKGWRDKEPLTIPDETAAALAAWLEVHPDPRPDAPLFVSLDRARRPGRLNGRSIGRMVKDAGKRSAMPVETSPHGLRHTGITTALDTLGGDVRKVAGFSRHRNLQTVATYDDARADYFGEVARAIDRRMVV